MSSQLLQQLVRHATDRPEAVALYRRDVDGARVGVTWAELLGGVAAVVRQLHERTGREDVVLLSVGNRPELSVAFAAALLAGRTVLMVPPDLTEAELLRVADRVGVKVVIGGGGAVDALRPGLRWSLLTDRIPLRGERFERAAAAENALAGAGEGDLLLQSSGTTGEPKVVRRNLGALEAVGENCRRSVGIGPSDRMLAAVPLYHSYGMDHGLMAAMLAGCAVDMQQGFAPADVAEGIGSGATIVPGVPFMFDMLATVGEGLDHRLRRVYSAGGMLPLAVAERFAETFGVRVGQIYGATEFGSVTFNDPEVAGYDPTSAGLPMRGVSLRILDAEQPRVDAPLPGETEGHVAVAAPSMLSGYFGSPGEAWRFQRVQFPPGQGREPSHPESSLGLMEVTT